MPNKIKPDQVVLSVYFSGSTHHISNLFTLGGILFTETKVDQKTHFKMGFNGCEVDYGLMGMVFGAGLERQCQQVHAKIIELLKQNKRVVVNAYGHSRGSVACYMLALMLRHYPRNLVKINLALLDPVPGNYVVTFMLDFFKKSLASQTFDLTQCFNLRRVLTLYPNKIASTILPYAPLLPKYPATCKVTNEIIHGEHSQTQMISHTHQLDGANYQSRITLNLISRFLRKVGTQFTFYQNIDHEQSEKKAQRSLLDSYNNCLRECSNEGTSIQRFSHSKPLTYIKTTPGAAYLSPTHERLSKNNNTNLQGPYIFSFDPPYESHSPKKRINKIENNLPLFKEFLTELLKNMSEGSKQTDKAVLLQKLHDELIQEKIPKDEFKDILRNVLAICLQRNKFAYSLYTTTTTARAAVQLLNSEKYHSIAEVILSNNPGNIRYRDLRYYVLGKNDGGYFNASKAQTLYTFFKTSELSLENPNSESKLFTNNMSFYLSR